MKNLHTKLLVSFTAVTIVAALFCSTFLFVKYNNYIDNSLKTRLSQAVSAVALLGEFSNADEIVDQGLKGDPTYKKILEKYHKFATDGGFAFAYILTNTPEGFVIALLSSDHNSNEELTFGSPYPDAPQAMFECMDKRQTMITKPYTDSYGTFKSAVSPLIIDGEVKGLYGIDLEISNVKKSKIEALLSAILALLIAVAVAIAYAYKISNSIVKPIRVITENARHFAVGDLSFTDVHQKELTEIKNRSDELGEIGKAFDSLTKYTQKNAETAQRIAEGDLTVSAEAAGDTDILGIAFISMIKKLNIIMNDIRTSSIDVDSGARQVSNSSQSLSDGANVSASSIEEISVSMVEMESQICVSAENANKASSSAKEAKEMAQAGSGEMANMITAMEGINESSQKIAHIIKVIDDIAFQTNLLALNAAVESARAGVHGKGFAVVADEVRNLSGRSAKAASETEVLIADAADKVKNGNSIAHKTEEALSGIVEQVANVSNLVSEIATASKEQARSATKVSTGLEQIDSVTQSNSANAEETAAASQELSSLATNLQHAVATFKVKTTD